MRDWLQNLTLLIFQLPCLRFSRGEPGWDYCNIFSPQITSGYSPCSRRSPHFDNTVLSYHCNYQDIITKAGRGRVKTTLRVANSPWARAILTVLIKAKTRDSTDGASGSSIVSVLQRTFWDYVFLKLCISRIKQYL